MKKITSCLAIMLVCMLCVMALAACDTSVTGIEVKKGSLEDSVLQYSTYDTSTAALVVYYSDNTEAEVDYSQITISGSVDTQVAGTYTLTLSYAGFSVQYPVTVTAVALPGETVSSITLTEGTVANKIEVGGTLDLSGAAVIITMDDGTSSVVSNDLVTFATLDTSTAGEKAITISYTDSFGNRVWTSHSVEVVGSAEGLYDVATLEVKSGTLTNSVQYQGTLDVTNLVLVATYGNGIIEYVSESYTMSTLDSTVLGDTTVAFSYEGATVDYAITVSASAEQQAKIATSIELTTSPSNKVNRLDTLDLTGVVASVTFMNGIATSFTYSDLTFSSLDNTTVGEQTLTVSFTDTYGNVVSVDYTVTVQALDSETAETLAVTAGTLANKVVQNGTLDTTDALFTVEFTNGSTTAVTAVTVALDSTKLGEVTAVLSYTDIYSNVVTLDWAVTIVDDTVDLTAVESIAVSGLATTADYLETYSTDSLVVVATYGDGTFATVTGATVTELDTTKLGSQDITVSYSDVTATHTVAVSATTAQQAKLVSSMTVVDGSVVKSIVQNGTLSTDNLKVYIVFLDETADTVGVDSLVLGSIDTSVVGETQTLTISYTDEFGNVTKITHSVAITEQPEDEVASQLTVVVGTLANKVLQNDTLDTTNTTFSVEFADGHTDTVATSTVSVVLDTTTLGETIAVLSYTDIFNNTITCDWAVEVVADDSDFGSVASIAISGLANAADYLEEYSTSNLVVVATYGDGTTAVVAGAAVTELDTTKLGSQDITVSYSGATATHSVTVSLTSAQSSQYAKSITLTTSPSSWVYRTSTLDTSTIVAEVTFMSGKTSSITASDLTIGSFDNTTVGDKALTVSYTDTYGNVVSVDYTVEVRALESETAEALSVTAGTLATSVNKGGTLDLTGAVFTVEYGDFNTATVAVSTVTVTTLDTTSTGATTAVLTYSNGYSSVTLEWAVTVVGAGVDLTDVASLAIKSGTVASTIDYNGTLDTSSLVLIVTYESGLVGSITSGFTTVVTDNKDYTNGTTLVVTYDGEQVTHNLTVDTTDAKGSIAASLTVTGLADKVAVGGSMDTSSMEVTVTYLSDTTSTLASGSYSMGTVNTSTAAEGKTVTISYTDTYGNVVTYTHTYDVVEASAMVSVTTLISELLTNVSAETTSSTTSFIDYSDSTIQAGDDNIFHFSVYATYLDSNSDLVKLYDLSNIKITITVERLVGSSYTTLEDAALAEYVEVDYTYGTFLFDADAIGETFRITMAATNPAVDGDADCEFTAVVSVVDGYNVYEAIELSLFDNADSYAGYNGVWSNFQEVTYLRETYKGTWTTDGTVTYATSTTLLSDIVAPDNFILQADIVVTADDLPAELFWSEENADEWDSLFTQTAEDSTKYNYTYASQQALVKDGTSIDGTLRYFGSYGIYYRIMGTEEETTFYGNYCTIDTSNIPLVKVNSYSGEAVDTTSSNEEYINIFGAIFYTRYSTSSDPATDYGADVTWTNVGAVGNGYNSGYSVQSGALAFTRNNQVNLTLDNCSISSYSYAVYYRVQATSYDLDDTNSLSIIDSKLTYCSMSHVYTSAEDTLIYNSILTDASGPAIIATAETVTDASGGSVLVYPQISVVASTIEAIVNASSTWFAQYGAGDLVTKVVPHEDLLFNTTNETSYALYEGTNMSDASLFYYPGEGVSQFINMKCAILPEGIAIGDASAYGTYAEFDSWNEYQQYMNGSLSTKVILDYSPDQWEYANYNTSLPLQAYGPYLSKGYELDILVDANTGGWIQVGNYNSYAHQSADYADTVYLYSYACLGLVLGLNTAG